MDDSSTPKLCSVENCRRPSFCRGLCNTHYKWSREGKDISNQIHVKGAKANQCSVEDCCRTQKGRTFCATHYAQYRSKGAVTKEIRRNNTEGCLFDGCKKKHASGGYCAGHYRQVQLGKPLTPLLKKVRGRVGCAVNGCESPHQSAGFCNKHYQWHYAYSLSVEDINALSTTCEICGSNVKILVDHDHSCCPNNRSCGKCVRGVLCFTCNVAIGMLGDSVESLEKVLSYLKRKDANE